MRIYFLILATFMEWKRYIPFCSNDTMLVFKTKQNIKLVGNFFKKIIFLHVKLGPILGNVG